MEKITETRYKKTVEVEKDINDLLRCKNNAMRKIEKERKILAQINKELQELVDTTEIKVEGYVRTAVKEMEALPLAELEKGREV
jgi:RNase adaptor protein for sRNA GlmZ degradation